MVVPIVLVVSMIACTPQITDDQKVTPAHLVTHYDYSTEEMQLAVLINNYRVSHGKNSLEIINHISYKSQEHNDYMIFNNVVNHDFFEDRCNNIIQVLGAIRVGENVAYNFSTPNSVLNAWLNSPGHKANLDGDYTHFGLSISIKPSTGKKYYTNMFMKR